MTSNATYVKTLSRRLNQLDQEIGRLVDEREAVRTVLSHEVPGEFDKVMLKSASDMRARALAVIDRGEVIDAATVTESPWVSFLLGFLSGECWSG